MASAFAALKQDWRHFKDDEPGHRFEHHRERMQKKSTAHNAISLVVGLLLLAGGIVLCFMPGPGVPLIIFGLALVGTHSEKLSKLLDRAEPPLRRTGHRLLTRWKALSKGAKAALVAAAALLTCAFLAGSGYVVAAYVL